MERRFKNIGLRNDSRDILKDIDNIGEVKTSDLSGHSIEIEFKVGESVSHSSYVYYEKKQNRDDDFKLLNDFLLEKI